MAAATNGVTALHVLRDQQQAVLDDLESAPDDIDGIGDDQGCPAPKFAYKVLAANRVLVRTAVINTQLDIDNGEARRNRQSRMWDSIRSSVAAWIIVTLIAAILLMVGTAFGKTL